LENEKMFSLILDNFKELKTDLNKSMTELKGDMKGDISELKAELNKKFETIENTINDIQKKMTTKEECKENRSQYLNVTELEVKKSEINYKRLIAIGTIITGTIAAGTTSIVTILKIFYG